MRLYKISTFFWHLKKRKKDLSAEDLRPVEAAILFCLPLSKKDAPADRQVIAKSGITVEN